MWGTDRRMGGTDSRLVVGAVHIILELDSLRESVAGLRGAGLLALSRSTVLHGRSLLARSQWQTKLHYCGARGLDPSRVVHGLVLSEFVAVFFVEIERCIIEKEKRQRIGRKILCTFRFESRRHRAGVSVQGVLLLQALGNPRNFYHGAGARFSHLECFSVLR